MPKSRVRKAAEPREPKANKSGDPRKSVYTPPPTKQSAKKKVSPVWLAPLMLACLLLGLAWIALYYITGGGPSWMASLGGWNLLGGFGLIVLGVLLSTQWR